MKLIERIKAMNTQYELPFYDKPTFAILPGDFISRMENFQDILAEELKEGDPVVILQDDPIGTLTELADWLGDIVVYCYSEAMRYGIPLDEVLSIIMDSNESKLSADGKPIKDERGKFLKGPYYWKPEPVIYALLKLRSAS